MNSYEFIWSWVFSFSLLQTLTQRRMNLHSTWPVNQLEGQSQPASRTTTSASSPSLSSSAKVASKPEQTRRWARVEDHRGRTPFSEVNENLQSSKIESHLWSCPFSLNHTAFHSFQLNRSGSILNWITVSNPKSVNGSFVLHKCSHWINSGGWESRRTCAWPGRRENIQCGTAPEWPKSQFPVSGEQTGGAVPPRCTVFAELLCSWTAHWHLEMCVWIIMNFSLYHYSRSERHQHSTAHRDAQLQRPKALGSHHLPHWSGSERGERQGGRATDVVYSNQNYPGPTEER